MVWCASLAHVACAGAPQKNDETVDAGGGNQSGSGGQGDGDGDGAGGEQSSDACKPAAAVEPEDPSPPAIDPNHAGEHQFFQIRVSTEDGTPIRGATVRTVGHIEFVSDDQGNVAFYEPGLMDTDVYFYVEHAGFERAADIFGYRGATLSVTEGGEGEITMTPTSGEQGPSRGDLHSRLLEGNVPLGDDCFSIRALDAQSGRGVPLVRVTAFDEAFWTDSQGMIAYCDPDHLGGAIEFQVFSHGYDLASGGTAITLPATAGDAVTVDMTRELAAERLYRITGAGIYADSVKLGLSTPTALPVLNGKVIGSDTGDATIYKGRYFWLWQDTHRVSYPLGNFSGTAAVSDLPVEGGLPASQGADLTYFVGEDGFAKQISEPFEPGGAPVWMAGLISVPDEDGQEQLFASYGKVAADFSSHSTGMMRWDPEAEIFERVATNFLELEESDPRFIRPDAYAMKFQAGDGAEHVYYPRRLRIPAEAAAIPDPTRYEKFTAYDSSDQLQYLPSGDLDYAYRADALPTTSDALSGAGVASDQDLDGHMRRFSTGESIGTIQTHSSFNPYRQRFTREAQGVLQFSELYFAEADTPVGPWVYAEKVVTHENYNSYNTSPHPSLAEGGGRYIFFESTYTTFLYDADPTPRYDYNQMMFRLDLDDDRVILPVPIYELGGDTPGNFAPKQGLRPVEVGIDTRLAAPFLAFDRPKIGAVPVRWSKASCAPGRRLVVGDEPAPGDVFYALPLTSEAPGTVALSAFVDDEGREAYSTADSLDGFTLSGPLARVYENPIAVPLPVLDYLGPLVADGGEDQCVSLPAGESTALVTLDAGESLAPEESTTSWILRAGEQCEQIPGKILETRLGAGTHVIELRVDDPAGHVSRDWVLVTVSE